MADEFQVGAETVRSAVGNVCGLLDNLWSSPSAGQLAGQAMAGSARAGDAAAGYSVPALLGYLGQAGMGDLASHEVSPSTPEIRSPSPTGSTPTRTTRPRSASSVSTPATAQDC